MKKVVLKLSALALALAMMLSMVSCRKNKDDKKVESSAPAVSSEAPADVSEPDDIGDIDDDFDDFDDFDDGDNYDDGDWSIVVDRPETDGAISRGVKYSFTEGDTDDDFDDIIDEDPDEWDNDDIGDIEEGDDYEYEPIIQKLGKAVSGGTRKIEIDNSTAGVEFTGFYGFSCNVYPTEFTLEAQTRYKDIPAYAEINAKRFNDSAPRYARSWFQCDWFMTNETGEDYEKYDANWEANPDYQNWMKGVYNFYSDEMNSAVEYWQMLEEAGTEIYLAYNWKNARRIQAWFGNDPMNGQIAAPGDLQAYAKGAVALFKHGEEEKDAEYYRWIHTDDNRFQVAGVTNELDEGAIFTAKDISSSVSDSEYETVLELAEGKKVAIFYDMKLTTKSGKTYDLAGDFVDIKLNLPDFIYDNYTDLQILHIDDEGMATLLWSEVADREFTFQTGTFSHFAIIGTALDGSSSIGDGSEGEIPTTGETAGAMFAAILAMAAAAFVAIRFGKRVKR